MREIYYDMLFGEHRDEAGNSGEAGVSSINGLSGNVHLLGPEQEPLPAGGQSITGIATKEYVDGKLGLTAMQFPSEFPVPSAYGPCIELNATSPLMQLGKSVWGIQRVQMRVVSADPEVTGDIVLLPILDGVKLGAQIIPVGASPASVEFALEATGMLSFQRDVASGLDTLKADGTAVGVLILNHIYWGDPE